MSYSQCFILGVVDEYLQSKGEPMFAESFGSQIVDDGYKFKNVQLLVDALTHSSFSEANNDVLHVLGSKVVQQAAAAHFILADPHITKGNLEKLIGETCNAKACASDALALKLEPLIMVGKGIPKLDDRILSGAFNAIYGGIALDDGPTTANFAYWHLKEWKNATDKPAMGSLLL